MDKNKIWWDCQKLHDITYQWKSNNREKIGMGISPMNPKIQYHGFGQVYSGNYWTEMPAGSIPVENRFPEVGEYGIACCHGWTQVPDGFITRIVKLKPIRISHSCTEFMRISHSPKHLKTIIPEIVQGMGWPNDIERILESPAPNPHQKNGDPVCPECGGLLGSWQLAPYCKKCNLIQPEINGAFIKRVY